MLIADVKTREVLIGPNCSIVFENDSSKNMTPTGEELIATLTMSYDDEEIKKIKINQLKGLENTVYITVFGHERVYSRLFNSETRFETDTTFGLSLRFQFKQGQIVDFKDIKDTVKLGINHDLYPYEVVLTDTIKQELIKDFA